MFALRALNSSETFDEFESAEINQSTGKFLSHLAKFKAVECLKW